MNRRSFIRTLTASGVSLFLPKVIDPMRWKRRLPHVKFLGVSDYIEPTPDSLHFNDSVSAQEIAHLLMTLFQPSSSPMEQIMLAGPEAHRAIKKSIHV